MLPATLGILTSSFQGRERATAFAAWGAVMGVAVALGPLLGGFLTTNYSWRWAFTINVIIAPTAIVGAVALHARGPPVRSARAHRRARRAADLVRDAAARLRHQRGLHLRLVAPAVDLHPRRCRGLADEPPDLGRARRVRALGSRSSRAFVRRRGAQGARRTRSAVRVQQPASPRVPLRAGHAGRAGDGPDRVPARDLGAAAGRPPPQRPGHRTLAGAVGRLHRARRPGRRPAHPRASGPPASSAWGSRSRRSDSA